jgi:hypothetical protein
MMGRPAKSLRRGLHRRPARQNPPRPGRSTTVQAIIDSGGVYGIILSNIYGGTVGQPVPVGNEISLYDASSQHLLYSYTVNTTNAPTVLQAADRHQRERDENWEYPVRQQPIYISNGPTGWITPQTVEACTMSPLSLPVTPRRRENLCRVACRRRLLPGM